MKMELPVFGGRNDGHKNRMPVLYGTRVMRMVVKMLALFMADDDSINKRIWAWMTLP